MRNSSLMALHPAARQLHMCLVLGPSNGLLPIR